MTEEAITLLKKLRTFHNGTYAKAIDEAIASAEPKKGRWLMTPTAWVYCSECNREPPNESNAKSDYCPNCGAMMEAELKRNKEVEQNENEVEQKKNRRSGKHNI